MCRGCKAKEQTITVLAEQVEWLRMQLGTPYLGRVDGGNSRVEREVHPAAVVANTPYVSEDEEDIRHMLEAGLIDPTAAEAALEQIGAFSANINID